ncbi:MAG: FAD-dependent oxidoreductase [Bacteroidota bacterium]
MATRRSILVIGGGAVGLCTAYYLNGAGCDVTVIDQGEIGSGSSLHNAGLVVPSHFIPLAAPGMVRMGLKWMFNPVSPFYIKPRLDVDLVRWLWLFAASCTAQHVGRTRALLRDMSHASLALYRELAHVPGMAFGFRRNGLAMLFRTEHGKRGAIAMAAQAKEIGVEARVLSRGELQELEPSVRFRASGAVYYPNDAHMNPALFLDQLRETLIGRGVRILTSTPALRFEQRLNGIQAVETPRGLLEADEFVLAGGAWSPEILRPLRLFLPLQAGKGYSLTVRHPSVLPRIPMLLEEARVAVTPLGDRLRFAGTMEIAGLSPSITRRRVEALANAVPSYLEGIPPAEITAGDVWAGLRPLSPDGIPFIGRFRRFENLIAATGHAMLGISLAPITGKLVAEIVEGRIPSIDLHLMRPERFQSAQQS